MLNVVFSLQLTYRSGQPRINAARKYLVHVFVYATTSPCLCHMYMSHVIPLFTMQAGMIVSITLNMKYLFKVLETMADNRATSNQLHSDWLLSEGEKERRSFCHLLKSKNEIVRQVLCNLPQLSEFKCILLPILFDQQGMRGHQFHLVTKRQGPFCVTVENWYQLAKATDYCNSAEAVKRI